MRFETKRQLEMLSKANVKIDGDLAYVLNSYWMYTEPYDPMISRWLREIGHWESWLTFYLNKQLEMADVFIDVGAHIGYYSLLAASRGVRTISFEPNQSVRDLLIKSMELNGFKAEVLPYAASNIEGLGGLTTFESNTGGTIFTPGDGDTRSVRIDDVVNASGDILFKIDVEGHEEAAWAGMQELWHQPGRRVATMEWVASRYENPGRFLDELSDGNWVGVVNHMGNRSDLSRSGFTAGKNRFLDVLIIKEGE